MRIAVFLVLIFFSACRNGEAPQPVIDMHRHAPLASANNANSSPADLLTTLDAENVVLAVVSITTTEQAALWSTEGRDRIILGAMMPCPRNLAPPWYACFPQTEGLPSIQWLRESIKSGRVGAIHEMMFNYDGSLPSDPRMTPYWALAEELDVPVGVHSWSGPPPGQSIRKNPNCCPNYDGDMGNPKNLRPVLEQFPNLKIWLQHVGSDGEMVPELWMETLALLADYPNVYVDLSITNSVLPIEDYEAAIVRLIDAGFGDRIMLGTDNLPVNLILDRLNEIDSVSAEQKSAILYGNAANFLGLSTETRRRHHTHRTQ